MIVLLSFVAWVTGIAPEELRADPDVVMIERIAVAIIGPDDDLGPNGGDRDGADDDSGDTDDEDDGGKPHDESPGNQGGLRPFGFISDIYNGF